ncbi:MAG: CtpF protein, partial [Pararhizobium sp.]
MSTIDYKIETASGEPDGFADTVRPSDVDHLRPLPRISVHAFCETEALQRMMERCGQDRRMSKVSLR